uniref:Uncharacterized protein n=1 Tax=Lactuca sativa TaxID=4236 RepID=A0A9R1V185_LACSA|nr:hypothetical protein LSAT_V11C700367700 [Lactuca sativa]
MDDFLPDSIMLHIIIPLISSSCSTYLISSNTISPPLHPWLLYQTSEITILLLLKLKTANIHLGLNYLESIVVLDHILPPAKVTPSSASEKDKDVAFKTTEQWSHLDAIVLQWICGTISRDVVTTLYFSKAV